MVAGWIPPPPPRSRSRNHGSSHTTAVGQSAGPCTLSDADQALPTARALQPVGHFVEIWVHCLAGQQC